MFDRTCCWNVYVGVSVDEISLLECMLLVFVYYSVSVIMYVIECMYYIVCIILWLLEHMYLSACARICSMLCMRVLVYV